MVCRVLETLQFVPHGGGYSSVQSGTKGLRDIQRDHSIPDGQAVAGSAYQETGKGTGEAERKRETALT